MIDTISESKYISMATGRDGTTHVLWYRFDHQAEKRVMMHSQGRIDGFYNFVEYGKAREIVQTCRECGEEIRYVEDAVDHNCSLKKKGV